VKSVYLKVGLPQQKIYTIKIALLTMMGWKDTGRLMISVTFYLYVKSAIPTYIEMALLMVNIYSSFSS
jgi:hypothetical protein